MIQVRHRGQLLKYNELNEIANNYILTKHAKEMIDKRCPNLNIKHSIKHPILAYFNTDGSVNIAINGFEYLVVSLDRFPYKIITFKEKSHNGIDIYSKRYLAQMGYCRKLFQ
jgi:hypothetical protein